MRALTNFERLVALLAADSSLPQGERYFDTKKVRKWVASGDEWAISYEYDDFEFEDHPLTPEVEQTNAIFEMFRFLQAVPVDELAAVSITEEDVNFPGFDGNNDSHFHIAKVLVEDLERWTDVRGATSNSHNSAGLTDFLDMHERYMTVVRRKGGVRGPLSALEASEILNK